MSDHGKATIAYKRAKLTNIMMGLMTAVFIVNLHGDYHNLPKIIRVTDGRNFAHSKFIM